MMFIDLKVISLSHIGECLGSVCVFVCMYVCVFVCVCVTHASTLLHIHKKNQTMNERERERDAENV